MFGIAAKKAMNANKGAFVKKAAAVATAGVLATAGFAATSGAAHASGFTVRLAPASNPFVFLDVNGGSTRNGASIIQWSLTGDNQVWTFRPSGTDYQIVNLHSGLCITTNGVAGAQLYQWQCTGSSNQLWSTSLTAGNLVGYTIKNVGSGLYMDVSGASGANGAAIDTWYKTGGSNQFFLAHAA
jgi:hypothetical protein